MRKIDPRLINMMLLGYGDGTRRLLELPVLADVWSVFASDPNGRHRLLLTAAYGTHAGDLADAMFDRADDLGEVAAIQGFVAGDFSLENVLGTLLPMTHWWSRFEVKSQSDDFVDPVEQVDFRVMLRELEYILDFEREQREPAREHHLHQQARQLIGLGLVAGTLDLLRGAKDRRGNEPIRSFQELARVVGFDSIAEKGVEWIARLHDTKRPHRPMIWIVTSNRRVDYATLDSLKTVKGDAARQLFSVDCSTITWAVLDSGIDEQHPAFADKDGKSRIKATYDFGQITRILDRRNLRDPAFLRATADELPDLGMDRDTVSSLIRTAAEARANKSADWDAVERLVRREQPQTPSDPHGTHVAGILGGYWEAKGRRGGSKLRVNGLCPDIKLIDIRVLGESREQSEFAVICALQFVRHLNNRGFASVIDGVNLSLSISHDVRSYACGKTPVCLEAEELIANGTVVVAAAGNNGYQSYQLATGQTFNSYAVASITDPGNAEQVITVGSTHRFAAHTYGVSYFSSRGPTGDGRAKPDLLAPGERITSAVPGSATDTLDGTSMAAPHVSGAAAILMARHRELRGEPAAIKKILCETATDVGRIADFQGSGLLDVLRALQHDGRLAL